MGNENANTENANVHERRNNIMKLNEEKIEIMVPDFCEKDCPCQELELETEKLFRNGDVFETIHAATCKNAGKCVMLLNKFKEDLIKSGEVEENIKRNKTIFKINDPFD